MIFAKKSYLLLIKKLNVLKILPFSEATFNLLYTTCSCFFLYLNIINVNICISLRGSPEDFKIYNQMKFNDKKE